MPGGLSRAVIDLASAAVHRRQEASSNASSNASTQGGLLTGQDPSSFSLQDPTRTWIIQLGIIVCMAQLLGFFLRRMRQPKVIAEVLGGILLGPTAFGRIPGFTDHIFPSESLPFLSLVAEIGLVLFLFLVGLEIESASIKKNARYSMPIALAGMVLPFGLGAALSVPLYNHYIASTVKFTNFMLFTGVAYSITAFPVLCRILTELKLLDSPVGIIVLSAGVGNDIIGWVLLALSVALVNASTGLTALYILLVAVAWVLVILFPVKRAMLWLAQRTGSIENGPTMTFMTVTMLVVFASGFFTDIIGIQAIFGGFLAGLVVPREGGLAIALTEKLEDMVSIIFLPLYFTISGLNTNLGLLNDGITWGFTFAICALAYSGKFGGCTIAAKLCGFRWREASTIGSLMSCKGLVELIVLNVGLQSGILTQTVFSMFVFEALVLTFMTTPAVVFLYPPEVRRRVSTTGPDYLSAGGPTGTDGDEKGGKKSSLETNDDRRKSRFTVVLDKLEHLPGMMTITQLISSLPFDESQQTSESQMLTKTMTTTTFASRKNHIRNTIDALRLIELSDRTSAVMKSSAHDTLIRTDPILSIFKTFGDLNNIAVSSSLSIVTYGDLASRVADHARDNMSHLVLVPWLPPLGSLAHSPEAPAATTATNTFMNPFDILFRTSSVDKSASVVHSQFIRGVFSECYTDVALFVDLTDRMGMNAPESAPRLRSGQFHVFIPFFGGPDDRLALEFAVQLCENPKTTATVLRLTKSADTFTDGDALERPDAAHTNGVDAQEVTANLLANGLSTTSMTGNADTHYGYFTTQTRLQSETADNITWARYASPSLTEDHPPQVMDALSRMTFADIATPNPVHSLIDRAKSDTTEAAAQDRNLIVVLGRSRRLAVEDHTAELKQLVEAHGAVGNEVRKTVGDVATALVVVGLDAGLIVVQASTKAAHD